MTEKKQSISAIREIFAAASETELPALYLEYEEDSRAGVQNLIQKYQKQEEALKKERERTEQMKIYEHKYEDLGWICGIDEVGRGPLAGPVVAGAVILPRDSKILYLNDSKQLTAKKRDELYDVIIRPYSSDVWFAFVVMRYVPAICPSSRKPITTLVLPMSTATRSMSNSPYDCCIDAISCDVG